jgi:ankyrin repeat protein
VNRLLAAGADPWLKTNEGKTAAELATQYGHIALAQELAARCQ